MKKNKNEYIEVTIEPDIYCFGDPWGETRCPELNEQDKCDDIKECYECKMRRMLEIKNSIKPIK